MRMWYGIDKEKSVGCGKPTLFVESKAPDIDLVCKALNIYSDKLDCIYFGAGEVDVIDWSFIDNLYKIYKIKKDFIIGLECTVAPPIDIMDYFDFIVLRVVIPYKSNKINIKYRTPFEVGVSTLQTFGITSLDTLNDGQYDGDITVNVER